MKMKFSLAVLTDYLKDRKPGEIVMYDKVGHIHRLFWYQSFQSVEYHHVKDQWEGRNRGVNETGCCNGFSQRE